MKKAVILLTESWIVKQKDIFGSATGSRGTLCPVNRKQSQNDCQPVLT